MQNKTVLTKLSGNKILSFFKGKERVRKHAGVLTVNPLAYTAVRETAGLAGSINTQPAVRRSEPSMSFAFNSSLLSVDGMTCLIPFES
jgi:hypothetical protein